MSFMASIYEELGGTYHLGADGFYYPDLLPPEEDTPQPMENTVGCAAATSRSIGKASTPACSSLAS